MKGDIITHSAYEDSVLILELGAQFYQLTVISHSAKRGMKLMRAFLKDSASLIRSKGELHETYKIDSFGPKISSLVGIQTPSEADKEPRYITPDTPFSNKTAIIGVIRNCKKFIQWEDKYFSREGLRFLGEALDKKSVHSVKILTSPDKADDFLRKSFKEFRKERAGDAVIYEMRVMNLRLRTKIHGRFLITADRAYSLPSADTIARGQYDEITDSTSKHPFDSWWKESFDILSQWNEINGMRRKFHNSKQQEAFSQGR